MKPLAIGMLAIAAFAFLAWATEPAKKIADPSDFYCWANVPHNQQPHCPKE